nr:hypothetical protein Itr_chr03CG25590 [Ipomoea trifida]
MRPRSLQLKHHRRSGSITFITPIIVCFVRTQNSAPAQPSASNVGSFRSHSHQRLDRGTDPVGSIVTRRLSRV